MIYATTEEKKTLCFEDNEEVRFRDRDGLRTHAKASAT